MCNMGYASWGSRCSNKFKKLFLHTVWLLRSYHLKIGGNCFDAMRQKIKNPAPLRTSLSSWLVRNGAGFLIFCLMASKQFPPFWPSLIVDSLYQFSTYRLYIILDRKYFFKSKQAFILTDKTKSKKINTVIYKPNLYFHVQSRKKSLIYLDNKVSIVLKNVIQNGWGLYKKLLHVETRNNNVNAGLQSICSIIIVKEHIFLNNVPLYTSIV